MNFSLMKDYKPNHGSWLTRLAINLNQILISIMLLSMLLNRYIGQKQQMEDSPRQLQVLQYLSSLNCQLRKNLLLKQLMLYLSLNQLLKLPTKISSLTEMRLFQHSGNTRRVLRPFKTHEKLIVKNLYFLFNNPIKNDQVYYILF